MEREMNFFDLCVACWHALGRACKAIGCLLARALRLSYRYWWLVLLCVALGVAAALYYTRRDNVIYRVNAVAVLNGPTVQQFEQAFMPLRSAQQLPPESPLQSWLYEKKLRCFETYRVIDCMNDSVADYIDFKNSSSPTDTVNVQMQDRLCLQFRIKHRDLDMIPAVEQEVMTFLNANPSMQGAYKTYMMNMLEQVRFNHAQVEKLDSLTDQYYFHSNPGSEPLNSVRNGLVFMGDWRVHLFLGDIYAHQNRTFKMDQRLQLATAPVVLENHFTVDSKPVNGRRKFVILFFLLGWIGACVLAELIDRRKAIAAWFAQ